MTYENLVYSKKDHIGYMTLNRPRAKNAINRRLAQEIADACDQIIGDDDIYVVVITGAGKAFCAGGEPVNNETGPAAAIASIDRPVIAAINGDALGEGLELALACDVRLAAESARLGVPQIAAGRIPVDGGTQRLARIVGRSKAMELLFTAEAITAGEALEIGLVSGVVLAKELMTEAEALAATIAGKAPAAIRYIKEAVRDGLDMPLAQGLRMEADLYFLLHTTTDRTEGVRAFLEKRKPHFKGG